MFLSIGTWPSGCPERVTCSFNRLSSKTLSFWMFYTPLYKLCATFRILHGIMPSCTRCCAKLVTTGANVVSKV